jgi:hypothetical protein
MASLDDRIDIAQAAFFKFILSYENEYIHYLFPALILEFLFHTPTLVVERTILTTLIIVYKALTYYNRQESTYAKMLMVSVPFINTLIVYNPTNIVLYSIVYDASMVESLAVAAFTYHFSHINYYINLLCLITYLYARKNIALLEMRMENNVIVTLTLLPPQKQTIENKLRSIQHTLNRFIQKGIEYHIGFELSESEPSSYND